MGAGCIVACTWPGNARNACRQAHPALLACTSAESSTRAGSSNGLRTAHGPSGRLLTVPRLPLTRNTMLPCCLFSCTHTSRPSTFCASKLSETSTMHATSTAAGRTARGRGMAWRHLPCVLRRATATFVRRRRRSLCLLKAAALPPTAQCCLQLSFTSMTMSIRALKALSQAGVLTHKQGEARNAAVGGQPRGGGAVHSCTHCGSPGAGAATRLHSYLRHGWLAGRLEARLRRGRTLAKFRRRVADAP